MEKLKGMIAPVATPFHEDESINYKVYEQLINYLLDNKIHGLLIGGSTGEYSLMTPEERKSIIKFASEVIGKRAQIIAGCSCSRTKDTIGMVQFAGQAGADYALALPPYYMQTSRQGIIDYYKEIAASTDIGIVIYHYPHATAVRMDPELIAELARIENVVGVKDTDVMANTARIINLTKDIEGFSVINGEEFNIIGTLAMGGDGCMGIVFNLVPKQIVALYDAFMSGDLAKVREINNQLMPLYALMEEEPYPGPIKAALELIGIPMGVPRKPIAPPSDQMRAKLKEVMLKANII
jgi:4-hydroxy-tetrahydrodipicolinate synthase